MKRFFTSAVMGMALLVAASVPASATAFTATIQVSSIISALNTLGSAFSGACGSTPYTAACGIYAVNWASDGDSSTGVTAIAGPSTFWSAATILSLPGVEINNNGTEQFISSVAGPTHLPTGSFFENINSTAQGNATTISTGTISFLVNNSDVDGTDSAVVLTLRAAGINTGTGADGNGKGTQNITVSATLTAAPEPSSIFLILTGIVAIGVGKFRLKRA